MGSALSTREDIPLGVRMAATPRMMYGGRINFTFCSGAPLGTMEIFAGKPDAARLYGTLVARVAALGPFEAQYKTASIHLARGSAFLGVHPRKSSLLLVLRTARAIGSGRVRKCEQVSAHRWHNEVLVGQDGEIDDELLAFVEEAYGLSAG